jgi:hypothetical protein
VPDDALTEVVYRALKDEQFFKALSKDPVSAVKNAGISLSAEDQEKLRQAMDGPTTVTLDLPRFLREAQLKLMTPDSTFRWVGFSWVGPFRKP